MENSVRPFTGRRMAAILVVGFAIVVGVNLTMAGLATSSFSGVVVENSYVASQQFNRWLDEAAHEEKLGWTVTPVRLTDGRVEVRMEGVPAKARISAIARHPIGREAERELAFLPAGANRFLSTSALPQGRWILRLEIAAGADSWRSETSLP